MAKKKRKLTAWQRHVKSYMAKHPGLSFKEALPKAKLTYRRGSNPPKGRASPRPRASSKPRKVKRKMAKRKRSRRKRTIPLAPVLGLAAGFIIPNPSGFSAVGRAMEGRWDSALAVLVQNYTGINPDTGAWNLIDARGLWALLGGLAVHKVASALGANRVLGAAGVPLIRI